MLRTAGGLNRESLYRPDLTCEGVELHAFTEQVPRARTAAACGPVGRGRSDGQKRMKRHERGGVAHARPVTIEPRGPWRWLRVQKAGGGQSVGQKQQRAAPTVPAMIDRKDQVRGVRSLGGDRLRALTRAGRGRRLIVRWHIRRGCVAVSVAARVGPLRRVGGAGSDGAGCLGVAGQATAERCPSCYQDSKADAEQSVMSIGHIN